MGTNGHDTLRFASLELDRRSRELRDGDRRVRLQEQPFEILCLLLERVGDVVTRDELRQRLWPTGTFVDFEHSLNAAIKRLRAALGDDADRPTFIETVPRRGYRFIGTQPVP
jgi:DNA-binding winged helix-turn-helix (wHTH) protein